MAHRIHSLRAALVLSLVLVARVSGAQQGCSTGGLATLIGCSFGPAGLEIDSESRLPSGDTHSAHFKSSAEVALATLAQLNAAFGARLATLPLPSPASAFTYSFDPASGVFTRSTRSFGPILGDRAETLGTHKLSVGLTFQSLSFDTVDGLGLQGILLVLPHDNPAAGGRLDVITSHTAITASTSQLTAVVNYGLTERIDVAVAAPLVSVDLRVAHDLSIQRVGTAALPGVHFFRDTGGAFGTQRHLEASASATGLGDLTVRGKWEVFRGAGKGIAIGANVRVPTGDEQDLLGSGAWGVRPFVILSASKGSFSPHLNLAYQWNGSSLLAGSVFFGEKGQLPDQIGYQLGVDLGIKNKATVAVDLLGTRSFSGVRFAQLDYVQPVAGGRTYPNTTSSIASYNVTDLALGAKVAQVFGRLLLDVGVVFKLDDASVRAKVTPLVGLEYSF